MKDGLELGGQMRVRGLEKPALGSERAGNILADTRHRRPYALAAECVVDRGSVQPAYFYLLKKMPPVVASFVYLIFPVLSILIDTMVAGAAIDFQFVLFTACILAGFAITKFATPR